MTHRRLDTLITRIQHKESEKGRKNNVNDISDKRDENEHESDRLLDGHRSHRGRAAGRWYGEPATWANDAGRQAPRRDHGTPGLPGVLAHYSRSVEAACGHRLAK